jgi:hypothetical protein
MTAVGGPLLVINIGGEGEVLDVINPQGPWVVTDPIWRSSQDGETFAELVADGHRFLICENHPLPFPDETFDVVITNGVRVSGSGYYGLWAQESEIKRVLRRGGEWRHDYGTQLWTKP